jgi:hypothetical protein
VLKGSQHVLMTSRITQMTKRGDTLSRVRYYLLLDQYIFNAQCGKTVVIKSTRRCETHEAKYLNKIKNG